MKPSGTADINKLYIVSGILIILGAFLSFGLPEYAVLAFPLSILIVGLFLISTEHVFFLVAFFTPLSIKLMIGTSGVNLPNEPLMMVLLLLFIVKLARDYRSLLPLLKHPLTVLILINLGWILITSITSSVPTISFKFLLARTWTVVFGFFWGAIIFSNSIKNIKTFFNAFGLGLCLVIVYTTINHYAVGFAQAKSMVVMRPLMDDHTVYSAVCSIVFAYALVSLTFKNGGVSLLGKILLLIFIVFCAVGIVFSYSRAALLSVVFVSCFYVLLKFKIRFQTLMVSLLLVFVLGVTFSGQIYQKVKFNRSVSGKNLVTDIRSISNVRTDESNVERINRWESGYRMFFDKPFFGFGPGTYMFQYSPYQRAHEMTSISTTHGTMGSMHSEYFGPLVESGVIGLLTTLLLFFAFIAILMRVYYQPATREIKMLALAVLLGMLTYFFHGLLNNFLDQDKIAVIFWAMMGMALALDLCNKQIHHPVD